MDSTWTGLGMTVGSIGKAGGDAWRWVVGLVRVGDLAWGVGSAGTRSAGVRPGFGDWLGGSARLMMPFVGLAGRGVGGSACSERGWDGGAGDLRALN